MSSRFDRKSKDWDKEQTRRELAGAVARALAGLPLHKDMLSMDFGCGTGLVGLPLAPRLGKIIALDSSPGMIAVLQQKIDEQGITNVECRLADITTAVLPQDFDLIFTSMTLHHIADIEAILARFAELLKPGGHLAIADLDAEDGSFHKAGSEEKHHGFDRLALTDTLHNHGFADITFEKVHTIAKQVQDGTVKDFTVFLAVAVKP
jgi:ubiquinone/menaquinone biosynthesis C-methylase UbiE